MEPLSGVGPLRPGWARVWVSLRREAPLSGCYLGCCVLAAARVLLRWSVCTRVALVEEPAVEEVVGDTVAARAAGAMVRIFACPRRVAFQAYADEPALLVCGSVARLSEPGPCSRVGKAEVPFDSLLAR